MSQPTQGTRRRRWRPSVRLVIAGALGLLGFLSALGTSVFFRIEADRRIRQTVGVEITQAAERITGRLEAALSDRLRELQVLASFSALQAPGASAAEIRSVLRRVQAVMPEYAILLFVAPDGRIAATSNGTLEGLDVSSCECVAQGREAPSVHRGGQGQTLNAVLDQAGAPRFVDLAVPVRADDGQLLGILTAHLFWHWAETIEAVAMAPILARHPGSEAVFVGPDGKVLFGQMRDGIDAGFDAMAADLMASPSGTRIVSLGGHPFVVGHARMQGAQPVAGLGWSAVVLLDADRAFAETTRQQGEVLRFGIAEAIAAAVLGWIIAGIVARPLIRLWRTAERLRTSLDIDVSLQDGPSEIVELSEALADLVAAVRQREAELRESGSRYRALIEAGSHMAWILQSDGTLSFTSRRFKEFTGVTADPISREGWGALIHPDDLPPLAAEVETKLRQGAAFEARFRLRRADGSWRWVLVRAEVAHDATGVAAEWVGTTIDVHELVTAQAELAAAEERLRLAMAAAELGSWDFDYADRTITWSERHFAMLGYEPDPSGQVDLALWESRVHPDDLPHVMAAWTRAETEGAPFDVTYRATRTDGRQLWLSGHGRAMYDPSGRRRFVGVIQDVTAIETARARLVDAEERLRLALEGTGEGLWDWNVETGEVWMSDRWLGLLGFRREEIAPHVSSWERLIHPEDVTEVSHVLQAHLEGRTTNYACEHRLRHRDGTWIWVLDRGKVVSRDAHGRPLRMVGTHQDITRRKLVEEALASSEARVRSVVDTAADAVLLADAGGHLVSANPAAARMFGYASKEDMVGLPLAALMLAEDAARHDGFLAAHMQRHKVGAESRSLNAAGRDLAGRRRDGSSFACEIAVASFSSAGERFFTGIVRDVTQRRAQEIALRDNEERFRLLVENIADHAIIMLDAEGRISSWNLGAERITLWSEDAILGKSHAVLWPEEAREAGLPEAALEAARSEGALRDEGARLRADGSTFIAETTLTALMDAQGRPRGFAKIIRDVTARHAAQRHLATLQARAMRASRLNAAGALAAGLAHELNQPLGAISNYASAARMALDRARQSDADRDDPLARAALNLRHVADQAVRAGGIVSRLRDFVGQSETQLASLRPRMILDAAVAEAQVLLSAAGGVQVEVDVADSAQDVFGDREQLLIVFANLIRNALDALQGRDGARIRLSARPMAGESGVEFRVSDNGPGLDASTARRLFEPFHSTKASGMGVGLTISRTIVEAHGGQIRASETSELGGATFVIEIPSGGVGDSPAAAVRGDAEANA